MSTNNNFKVKHGLDVGEAASFADTVAVQGNVTLSGTSNNIGTVTAGNWKGTAVPTQYGGTGKDLSTANGYFLASNGTISTSSTIPGAALTGAAASTFTVPWSGITSKPTTISGYGITDNIAVKNSDGTLTVADPTLLTQAVSGQYFYNNTYLNFESKVGKGNDPYRRVLSKVTDRERRTFLRHIQNCKFDCWKCNMCDTIAASSCNEPNNK